jgi:hypothetical protein
MESIYKNIDRLEESQNNITVLLERLDRDTRTESTEVGQLITGMEGILGQFSDNHFELQHEIEDLLESSRRGMLSHEKLTEMVNAEQVRTQYLSSIVNSLKSQIEGLFNKLQTEDEEEDEYGEDEPIDVVDKVTDDVNLLWKSVDSLSKLISSPTKKLEYNIQKIDSEVIVHLNKSLHLHDKKEDFRDKLEHHVKQIKHKREKSRSPMHSRQGTGSNTGDLRSDDFSARVEAEEKRKAMEQQRSANYIQLFGVTLELNLYLLTVMFQQNQSEWSNPSKAKKDQMIHETCSNI